MLLLKDQTFISSQIPTEGGEGTAGRLVFLLCAWADLYAHTDRYSERVCEIVAFQAAYAPVHRSENTDPNRDCSPHC